MFPKLTAVFVLSALLLAPSALGKPMPASPSGLAARAGPSGLARRAHNQAAASSAMKLAGNYVAHSGAVRRAKAKDNTHTLHKRQDPDADTADASADDIDAGDSATNDEVTSVDDGATDDDAPADAVAEDTTPPATPPLGKRQDDPIDGDNGETSDESDDAAGDAALANIVDPEVVSQEEEKMQQDSQDAEILDETNVKKILKEATDNTSQGINEKVNAANKGVQNDMERFPTANVE